MRPDEEKNQLDRALEEIRKEPVDPETVRRAGERVWERIAAELPGTKEQPITGCADFQALLPEYRAGNLPEARMLLVRDHLRECIACRKKFMGQTRRVEPLPEPRRPRFEAPRWAIAAMLAIAVGLGGWEAFQRFGPAPEGPAAQVATVDGTLYKVSDDGTVPLHEGDQVMAGETVRSARGTFATLRLRDSSVVEMRERSGFAVRESRRDVTLKLAGGSVIVEAAKRSSGHLYVSTRDCRVAVTGTVFSVNSGVKGSRVSVVEGEVRVVQAGREAVLGPGEQYSSSPAVSNVPVAQEIAWSENADRHIAMMKELLALGREMEQQVRMPAARYASPLLGFLPANTAFYLAIPNLGEPMAEAFRVVQRRIGESPTLAEWWEREMGGAEGQQKIDSVVDELRRVAAYLGDEIVIAAAMTPEGRLGEPALLAELKQDGFAEFLQAELAQRDGLTLRSFTSAAEISGGAEKELLLYTNRGVAVLAPDAESLRRIALAIEGGGGGFAETPLAGQIAESYREGASFLFSADLESIKAAGKDTEILGNVRDVVVGQKQIDGHPDTRVIVSFAGERTGMASWLAEPAPIGALDYVSSGVSIVAAAAVKQPSAVLDDLMKYVPGFAKSMAEAEAELGISVRDEVAGAFGSEFAIALDGPAFPIPSWKVVAEVYDPDGLQVALRSVLDVANRKAAEEGVAAIELREESAGGRTYYTLHLPDGAPMKELHYTFTGGYLIAAPTRALIDSAIASRASGNTLVTSAEFISLFPRDSFTNFSAMLYHNVGPAVAPLAGVLTEEQKQALGGLDEMMKPALVLAYGARDNITVASTSEAFGFTPGNLFGLKVPMSLGAIFGGGKKPMKRGTAVQ